MKLKINEQMKSNIIVGLSIVIISILVFFAILNTKYFIDFISKVIGILSPIIVAFCISYIALRPLNFFERMYNKINFLSKRKKLLRVTSITTVYFLGLGFLAIIFIMLIPSLIDSVEKLSKDLPSYLNSFNELLKKLNIDGEFIKSLVGTWEDFVKKITSTFSSILPNILSITQSVTSTLLNFVLGSLIAIYMLYSKEFFANGFKKVLKAFMHKKMFNRTISITNFSHNVFNKYIYGQLTDALIVGSITFIFSLIVNLPYPIIIAVIIAITNVIPFFGPYIGVIPTSFIILIIQPNKLILFLIFIIILQQIDGNILVPKIVGNAIGLSGFWVVFALLLFGGLFGILGMLIGVPVFTVIYNIFKNVVNNKIKQKEKLEEISS